MRNRITNGCVGISSQPGLGGPNYFIRNVMFNLTYNAYGTQGIPLERKFGSWTFAKLPGTEFEPHGVQLGDNPVAIFQESIFPAEPGRLYPAPDLRPIASSPVLDIAQPIANVNDGFTGSGPDIGAYEYGQPLPVYGPRPRSQE